jgi:acetyl esterase/lipase
MSILMSIARLYARAVYRKADELDSLATQKKLSLPCPPRKFAGRCRPDSIGDVKVVWVDEQNAKNGVLVYLHGGAYYFGPVKEHWDYIATISARTQMAALMIDYRMAPLYPFPHSIEDVLRVIENVPPANWCLLGDSSGAAMAVATALKLKEAGKGLPRKIIPDVSVGRRLAGKPGRKDRRAKRSAHDGEEAGYRSPGICRRRGPETPFDLADVR